MPKKTRTPEPSVDLRRAVLDASLELIDEGGLPALSMREVARRAKVTHGAPYHHFADRAAVIATLAEEGFLLLGKEMIAAMERERVGSIARFEACGLAYFRFATQHAAYMRLMFRPELASPVDNPGIETAAAAAMQVLIECVLECQRAGTVPKGDPMPLVLTSWAAIHGLSALWLDGRLGEWAGPPREVARTVARTLGNLVAAKGKGR